MRQVVANGCQGEQLSPPRVIPFGPMAHMVLSLGGYSLAGLLRPANLPSLTTVGKTTLPKEPEVTRETLCVLKLFSREASISLHAPSRRT